MLSDKVCGCDGGSGVPSILPFIKPSDGFFDDMATQAMGKAFDAAHKTVDGAGQFIYETVAAQIIAAAHKGERDPVRLRSAGLAGLGYEGEAG
jgi:hypothetical protein